MRHVTLKIRKYPRLFCAKEPFSSGEEVNPFGEEAGSITHKSSAGEPAHHARQIMGRTPPAGKQRMGGIYVEKI
jgi:hypothetical protein